MVQNFALVTYYQVLQFPNSTKKLINMSCCPQHKDWNYFQAEMTKMQEKETRRQFSTSDTFQRKYENFD